MTDRWPALLSKKDAANYLGVSLTQLQRMLSAGGIVPKRISDRRIGIKRADLDDFIDSLPDQTAKQRSSMRPSGQTAAEKRERSVV